MKVLFVQKVKALVGSEKYFLELVPELQRRDIQVEFICIISKVDSDKAQEFVEAYQSLSLKLHVKYITDEKAILSTIRFIRSVYKKGKFDLVHSHLIHADFWCALLKMSGSIKAPIVSTKHGYDEVYIAKHGFDASHLIPNRYLKLCRFSERSITKSFAVSNGLKKLFIDAKICQPHKISTIYHGFNLPKLDYQKNFKFRSSPNQLVILGRIIPFKGHKYLIEALHLVKKEIPNIHLKIVGHGDQDLIDKLKEKIDDLELNDNVSFLGYQSNIYDYLINSDLMIVPSISEGFGLIFLEALNAKLPIVGFDVPATNEIITHNVNGLLSPLRDSDSLAKNIISLLDDHRLREKFSSQGHKKLLDYHSLDRMVSETIVFYKSVLTPLPSNRDRE